MQGDSNDKSGEPQDHQTVFTSLRRSNNELRLAIQESRKLLAEARAWLKELETLLGAQRGEGGE
jgi:hypothetical protein